MIFPFSLHIGTIAIPIHLVTDIASLYVGYAYYLYLVRKKESSTESKLFPVVIGAAIGALVGSRLLAALCNMNAFLHPSSLLYYYAGKTIVGALIGGILGVEIAKKIVGIKTSTGDIFVLPLIVGMIVGRIGCFLTGVADDTVGNPSHLPWAFDQGDGIARHPTALYEIIFLAILFLVLQKIAPKVSQKSGLLFRLFMISYLLFRFFVDFIKPGEFIFLGFTVIQVASLVVALYYVFELCKEFSIFKKIKIINA